MTQNSLPTKASGAGPTEPAPSSVARVCPWCEAELITLDRQHGYAVSWRLCGCCGCSWHGRRQVHELAWLPACGHVPGRAA